MPERLWDKFPVLKVEGGESFYFQFTRHIPPCPSNNDVPKEKPIEACDHKKFGPILGVSDEGSAAKTIADAAYTAAKAQAHGSPDESVVGVIIDGERMGSARFPSGRTSTPCSFPPRTVTLSPRGTSG